MPTRLRYWRERRGLTQTELARTSTVGVATIRRIEAGRDTFIELPVPSDIDRPRLSAGMRRDEPGRRSL